MTASSTCTCGAGLHPTSNRTAVPCSYCCSAPLVIVGDCPSWRDLSLKQPFRDAAGKLLREELERVGIRHAHLTTVFKEEFDLTECVGKVEAESGTPAIAPSKYLPPSRKAEVKAFRELLEKLAPQFVLALGNVPLWALTNQPPKIKKLRGTSQSLTATTELFSTYSPKAVLQQYQNRVVLQADLEKLSSNLKGGVKMKERNFLVLPSREELVDYIERTLRPSDLIAFDIETIGNRYITCVGFACCGTEALCVPFVHAGQSFWSTPTEEVWAWERVQEILHLPAAKLAQNGLFDLQYLYSHGLTVKNFCQDTMILSHALQPEMEKSLAFLASVYLNESEWKSMRQQEL